MTKEQILRKAIEKAVKNGYDVFDDKGFYYQTIFSHDFAKAFFNDPNCFHDGKSRPHAVCADGQSGWQCHLQQLVLEKNPIKYLERFL